MFLDVPTWTLNPGHPHPDKHLRKIIGTVADLVSLIMAPPSIPRIEYLRVQNYRALHNLELKKITPLTVFLGPNGSGKSTIFDVFAFLSECFTLGLRKAWDKRGRFRELRTRGENGLIIIELKYREKTKSPLITYHLAINELNNRPLIAEEWLQWTRGKNGRPFRFLEFKEGEGKVISGEMPDANDERISEKLESNELLAVSTLGQFAKHPRISALRHLMTNWCFSKNHPDNRKFQLVGIEEPENHLYPRLLSELATEYRTTATPTQLIVTTHSPFFVDGLKPEEVWVFYRNAKGFTQARRTLEMQGVKNFINNGALLGQLWMENYFDVGHPYCS